MKTEWLRLSYWALLILALGSMFSFVMIKGDEGLCRAVELNIDQKEQAHFVSESDIWELINQHYDSVLSLKIKEINIDLLEESIEALPFVARAEVYSSVECELRLDVFQKKPIARVITGEGSFYLDESGSYMPLHQSFTARVPVISGSVPDSCFKDCAKLIKLVQEDELLKAQLVELNRSEEGDFKLYPRMGAHEILWGDISSAKAKAYKLKEFYSRIMKKSGLDYYKQIDLRFEDQVVGTKR